MSRAWRDVHNTGMRGLCPQRNGRNHVGAEVNRQDLRDGEGQWHPEKAIGQIGNHLRHVTHEDIGGKLPDIVEDRPAFFNGVDDGRKVVVEQNHVRRFLRHVGSGDAHRNADIGFFDGRGVVHPVARDGHHFAHIFQHRHDAHLVPGSHAREDRLWLARTGGREEPAQFLVAHRFDLVPFDHGTKSDRLGAGLFRRQPDLAGDGQGREWMVAGNHDHAHAGLPTARDGFGDFLARGIHHRYEAEEGEVLFHLVDVQLLDTLLNLTHGDSQDPIGLVREGLALRHDALPVLLAHRCACRLVEHLIAEGHERFRRALHEGHEPALAPMERGHALPVCVERELAHPGQRLLVEEPVILCKLDQRHFGRIACDGGAAIGPPHAFGIMAVDDRIEERRIFLGLDCARHASGDYQTAFLHLDFEMVHIETRHAHPVFGERSRLICADDGGAAQGFHGRQLFDEGVTFGHTLAAQRQGQCHRGEQSFRHVRRDDADPEDRADPEAEAGP